MTSDPDKSDPDLESYDFDEDDAADHDLPHDCGRPSWRFTVAISTLAMFCGVIAGIVGDGSVEVLNGFYETSTPTRRAIAHIQTNGRVDPAIPIPPAQPAWFPDNNQVEWSTSLRPNERPAAIDVRNESQSQNRRILFQMADGRTYRLAATLFVKAGQQAVIRLPMGSYRVDISSSPVQMSWAEAQSAIPIPRFALTLSEPDDDQAPRNRIFIEEDGKVRPSTKPKAPDPQPVADRKIKKRSSDPDYGAIAKESLNDREDSEVSETFPAE